MNFNTINKLSENKILLLLFVVKNCTPCKLINTIITNNVFNYKDIQYIILDINENKNIYNSFSINVLPTIIFYHKSKKIKTIIGNEENELLEYLKNLNKTD